jgi:hypothetical protein
MSNLIVGLVIVVGMLGGFYVGARYGQGHPAPAASPAAATASGAGGGAGGAGAAGGGFGSPAATGQIVAVSGNQITVHDRLSNTDVKVNIAAARISKTTQGTPADLTQNENVTVVGLAGTDGVVTAQTIAIGAGAAAGGRQGRPQPTPSG